MATRNVSPLLRAALAALAGSAVAASLLAQQPDDEPEGWDAKLHFRKQERRDLIALRYRRDEHGLLEVAGCEGGSTPFQLQFPRDAMPHVQPAWSMIAAALLLSTTKDCGVLDAVDAERHLRRAGIDPAPVELRQFLLTPCARDDAERARVDALDRAVALLHLRRCGQRGVVAECTALLARSDTPPELRAQATAAIAAFGKAHEAQAPRRLAADNLVLPVNADAFAMIDHARLPDLAPLRLLARQLVLSASYRVVEVLRAPTPDDLFHGQHATDVLGETAFEVVRRFGDAHLEQSVVALLPPAPSPRATALPRFTLQAVGNFDAERAAAACCEIAAIEGSRVTCTAAAASATQVRFAGGEASFDATSLAARSTGVACALRPELARELLADGPCLRVLVHRAFWLWRALGPDLAPPERAEITVAFAPTLRVVLALTADDEAGAAAWAEFGRQRLAAAADALQKAFAEAKPAAAHVRSLRAALAAVRFQVTGARVDAVFAGDASLWSEHAAALIALPGVHELLR